MEERSFSDAVNYVMEYYSTIAKTIASVKDADELTRLIERRDAVMEILELFARDMNKKDRQEYKNRLQTRMNMINESTFFDLLK